MLILTLSTFVKTVSTFTSHIQHYYLSQMHDQQNDENDDCEYDD